MSDLPAGWTQTTLGQLAAPAAGSITDGPFGSNLTSAHYSGEGARVIRLENIGDGFFRDARSFVPLDHFERLRKHEAHPGDLIVASLGEQLPRACLVPDLGVPALVKADCIRIRLRTDVNPKWALYSTQTPAAKRWAEERLRGVGRQRLGLKGIRDVPVSLPPLDEQHRIVAVLEDHLSRLDAARDYAAAASARLALLSAAGLASTIRDDWTMRPLSQLIAEPLANGRSVPDGTGAAVLRLTALQSEAVNTAASKTGAWTEAEARPFRIARGDLLLARGNGSLRLVAKAAIVEHEPPAVAFPDTMIRIRPDEQGIEPRLLLALWNSRIVRRQVEAMARTTAGIYKVNQKQLLDVQMPVPPKRDQAPLLASLGALDEEQRRLLKAMTTLQRQTESMRRSLLSAAVSGRL